MSILTELYDTKLKLEDTKQELAELREQYEAYRIITESNCNNKQVREIKKHISWYDKKELMEKMKEVTFQEWLENSIAKTRRQERRRDERRREQLKEKKKRAAERKALEELMEKERRNRARKNTEAN